MLTRSFILLNSSGLMKNDKSITTSYVESILNQTKSRIDYINYSIWIVFQSFLMRLRWESVAQFDNFIWVKDSKYLSEIKEQLSGFRKKTKHKYKILHYTYLISRIDDRLLQIQYGGNLSDEDKLNHIIKQWDISLISYSNHGHSWNDLLNQWANNLLRLFSHSLFAHIGLIGRKIWDWFEWIHSTLHNEDWRTWVKVVNLHNYITPIRPCDMFILRPKTTDSDIEKTIVQSAHHFADQKVWYDTRDAIGDITWYNRLRVKEKFNCGELVYYCLKSIIPNIRVSKKSIPSSYLSTKYLEQVYITTITDNE